MTTKIKVKDVFTDIFIFIILVYQTNNLPFIFVSLFFTLLFRLLAIKIKSVDENTIIYIISVILASKLIFKVFYFTYPDYIALILLIMALAVIKNRIFKWIVPVILILGTIINEGIIIYFTPLIMSACFYEGHKDDKSNYGVVNSIILVVSIMLSFYYLDIQISSDLLSFMKNTMLFFLPVLPIVVLFIFVWIRSYKNCADKTIKKVFLFCLCQPLIIVLINGVFIYNAFNLNMVFLTQFCFLFYFFVVGEKSVLAAVEEIKDLLTKHFIVQFLPLAYLIKYNSFLGY